MQLIRKGANINACSSRRDGGTPLHEAAATVKIPIAQMLMAAGASPFVENHHGAMPISLCCGPHVPCVHHAAPHHTHSPRSWKPLRRTTFIHHSGVTLRSACITHSGFATCQQPHPLRTAVALVSHVFLRARLAPQNPLPLPVLSTPWIGHSSYSSPLRR